MTLKPMLAALIAVAAMPATAQSDPMPGRETPTMTRHDPAMMEQHRAAMRQRRADDMALLLDLKPAQRPALDAFLRAAHPGGAEGPMGHRRGGEGGATAGISPTPPNFAERLDRMDRFAARRAEAGHQRIAAVKAFYQSLDPHQQQLFEAVMRLRHGHGGEGGMGAHMHGSRPGGPGPMGGPGAPQD